MQSGQMSQRRFAWPVVLPSPKSSFVPMPGFNDLTLAKFINCVMLDGKKSAATRVMYDAMDLIDKPPEEREQPGRPRETPLDGVPAGHREREAVCRGRSKRHRWCQLPGADAGAEEAASRASRSAGSSPRRPQARRAARWPTASPTRSTPPLQERRQGDAGPRADQPHGRGQQGVCALRVIDQLSYSRKRRVPL